MLSDDREETEATDRGRDEDGMVKDRTMDRGRLPRRSSRLEGCRGEREGQRERGLLGVCPKRLPSWDHVVFTAWTLDQNCEHLYEQHTFTFGVKAEKEELGFVLET